MSPSNGEVIRILVEEVANKGNLSLLDEIIHGDYVFRSPREELHGAEELKDYFAMLRTAFPDLNLRIDDLIVEGAIAAYRLTIRGTHQGDFTGVAATGKQVKVSGMVVSRFDEGKIIEEWEILDELSMLQQLGVVSMPT